jgi:hypothetical protein
VLSSGEALGGPIPPKHSETQLPERLQNGCRITVPAYAHRDSIGLATALARDGNASRIPDLAIPRCAIAAAAHARGARGISRASFSTAGARVPRAERRGVTVTPCAVPGRVRAGDRAPRVDRAPSLVHGVLGVKSRIIFSVRYLLILRTVSPI